MHVFDPYGELCRRNRRDARMLAAFLVALLVGITIALNSLIPGGPQ